MPDPVQPPTPTPAPGSTNLLTTPQGDQPKPSDTPSDPKPGDLLSPKKADGTDKTAEELAADKTAHEAELAKSKGNGEDTTVSLDKIKAPEGIDLKSPLAKEFVDLLNNKDLKPAERPQKLVDLVGKLKQQYDDAAAQIWLDQNTQWQAAVIKEWGGEEKTQAILNRIGGQIEAYAVDLTEKFKASNPGQQPPDFGKGLRQAVTSTGAGNNPEIIRFLHWMADQLGEGAPLSGGTPGGSQKSMADRLFDGK